MRLGLAVALALSCCALLAIHAAGASPAAARAGDAAPLSARGAAAVGVPESYGARYLRSFLRRNGYRAPPRQLQLDERTPGSGTVALFMVGAQETEQLHWQRARLQLFHPAGELPANGAVDPQAVSGIGQHGRRLPRRRLRRPLLCPVPRPSWLPLRQALGAASEPHRAGTTRLALRIGKRLQAGGGCRRGNRVFGWHPLD